MRSFQHFRPYCLCDMSANGEYGEPHSLGDDNVTKRAVREETLPIWNPSRSPVEVFPSCNPKVAPLHQRPLLSTDLPLSEALSTARGSIRFYSHTTPACTIAMV